MANRSALAGVTPARPRLMATTAAIARMRATVQRHAMASAWSRDIIAQADHLLTLAPLNRSWVHDPVETAAAPLPTAATALKGGAPATPLDIARLFVLRIETLSVVWFLTGEPEYRDRATAELLAICGFPDWLGDEFLVTAETTFGAALGYDWLFPSLPEKDRKAAAAAIVSKGIRPGLDQFAMIPPAHWVSERMNWNLVCNSALMIAALAVAETDRKVAEEVYERCLQSVRLGFSECAPDGGWAEGPGYWHYATQYAVYLIDSLKTACGHDFGLGASTGFGVTGLYRLHAAGPSGKLFNYADSAEEHSGGYWLFWLGHHYHHPVDAWIERHRGKPHPLDLLWFDPDARSPVDDHLPPHKWFHGIEVAMLRSDWQSPDATYIGVKAGANDACPHAHYDLGSFVLETAGVRWAIDLGPDDYNLPEYFEPEQRATYYRSSTMGHNTLIVNGECQPPTARARIRRAAFESELACVVVDLSAAYPACARVVRGIALIASARVLIVDEIVAAGSAASIAWQMHTRATVQTEGATAVLMSTDLKGATTQLTLRILEPIGAVFHTQAATPTGAPGQDPNTGVVKLVIDLGAMAAASVRLAVMISPGIPSEGAFDLPMFLAQPVGAWAAPA
jgi:hypothetical protein